MSTTCSRGISLPYNFISQFFSLFFMVHCLLQVFLYLFLNSLLPTDHHISGNIRPRNSVRFPYAQGRATTEEHKIGWLGLEGPLKSTQFQPCVLGHLPPSQTAQIPINPGFEHFQGLGSYSFPGQPVPASHYTHSKEFLSSI